MLDKDGHGCFAGCFLEESMATLRSECKNVVPVRLDVTNAESVAQAAAIIAKHVEGRGLDGVVNNAGILISPGPVEWIPVESVERMLKVNVLGTVAVTKSVLPLIRKAHGRIVNVASIAGRVGLPANGAYCASKFAVEGFSDVLRREMADWDVSVSNQGRCGYSGYSIGLQNRTTGCWWAACLQVHIIEPGVFKTTNLYKTFISDMDKMWAALPNDVQRDYGEDFYKTSRFKLENYVSQQVIS